MAQSPKAKLALFGDSFGVNKHTDSIDSWISRLRAHFDTKNFCQCGVGQYKILKQIQSVDLSEFDQIIITHTAPTRVYVEHNPLHRDSQYHQHCDVIFADIENNTDEFSIACRMYFKHLFDLEHAMDIHNLICEKIDQLVSGHQVIHMTHFDYRGLFQFRNMLNFHDLFLTNRGSVAHYDKFGNDEIYKKLSEMLHLETTGCQ
jgi:hypothetical protein